MNLSISFILLDLQVGRHRAANFGKISVPAKPYFILAKIAIYLLAQQSELDLQ